METLKKFLTFICIGLPLIFFTSCGAGIDYDPETATLTFVPGEFAFGDLKPDQTADALEAQAKALEAKGEGGKALKIYKTIAEDYAFTTQAPNARFRMAEYYEAAGKQKKAFDNYQTLITTYMGTPLYKPALDRQGRIARDAATGQYKRKVLLFRSRLPASTVDQMLKQHIDNAPYASDAAQSQYLRGLIWENEKILEKAMEQYREVTRAYPESQYSGEALFRTGSILYEQAQNGNTNLDNSKLALETFDELIVLYPNHPKVNEAKALRSQIQGYDVRRSLQVAEFYEKKKEFTSARFYYNDVMTSSKKGSNYYNTAKQRLEKLGKPSN